MTFAEKAFHDELKGMLEQFTIHYRKLEWIGHAATGAILFLTFLEWIKEDEKRIAAYAAVDALDIQAGIEAKKANIVAARECAKQYYNGLYRLYKEYDGAVAAAYRSASNIPAKKQEELSLKDGAA